MRPIILILALVGCGRPRESLLPLAEYAIHQRLQGTDHEPLSRVVLTAIPGHPDLHAAIYDYQREWWGSFGVYHVRNGVVDWQAEGGGDPTEQSIHRIRAYAWPGFQGPIIEVIGTTHMGNGFLYLYELRGRQLQLLLQTRALTSDNYAPRVRNYALDIAYPATHPQEWPNVVLSGELEEYEEGDEMIVNAMYCRKVFTWSPGRGRYVEKLEERCGFPDYWD